MDNASADEVRDAVREHYGKVAEADAPGCAPGCCGGGPGSSLKLGYSEQDLAGVPAGADLGLGCGNPQAIAELRSGETVIDLGSGAGFDCFLAAKRVGPGGKVIGIDMTPSMVTKARSNAKKAGIEGVEFRLGEIEHLPVADDTGRERARDVSYWNGETLVDRGGRPFFVLYFFRSNTDWTAPAAASSHMRRGGGDWDADLPGGRRGIRPLPLFEGRQ